MMSDTALMVAFAAIAVTALFGLCVAFFCYRCVSLIDQLVGTLTDALTRQVGQRRAGCVERAAPFIDHPLIRRFAHQLASEEEGDDVVE